MEMQEFPGVEGEVVKRALKRTERGRIKELPNPNLDPIAPETYRKIFEKLVRPGDKIINVGAGFSVDVTGIFNGLNEEILEACTKKNATLIVMDIDQKSLLTHKDLKELTDNENLQVVRANGLKMPIQDGSIGGIVSTNLINCPEPERDLRKQASELFDEAARVIRPGGFIVVSSFGYAAEGKDKEGKIIYNNRIKEKDLLTLDEIEKIIASKGFSGITKLDVDREREEFLKENLLQNPTKEAGGFLAYKNKN
ncbi:MAG: methyltransferase domain-containing protein [Candidatus Liptonbacteria bacterium]|nr:methyltransferase domain-containing protein [Candidatus Liptonbacteria bacterium]